MIFGDKVSWRSHAGSHATDKSGVVIEVVPPGVKPRAYFDPTSVKHTRPYESYIVMIDARAGRRLYWLRTSILYAGWRPMSKEGLRVRRLDIGETPVPGDLFCDSSVVTEDHDSFEPISYDDYHYGECMLRLFPIGDTCPRCDSDSTFELGFKCLSCNPKGDQQ